MNYRELLQKYETQVAEWETNRLRNAELDRLLEEEAARVRARRESLTAEKSELEVRQLALEEIPAVAKRVSELDAELALLDRYFRDRKEKLNKEQKATTGWRETAKRDAGEYVRRRIEDRVAEIAALLRSWSGGRVEPQPGFPIPTDVFDKADPLIGRARVIVNHTIPEGEAECFLKILRETVASLPPEEAAAPETEPAAAAA